MMTADGSCIGSKYGIGFVGKWVWGLKDFIDMGFMNLFNPKYLFKDYEKQGVKEPVDNYKMFDDEEEAEVAKLKERVAKMTPEEAGAALSCSADTVDYMEKWQIIQRMHNDIAYQKSVIEFYNPPYI